MLLPFFDDFIDIGFDISTKHTQFCIWNFGSIIIYYCMAAAGYPYFGSVSDRALFIDMYVYWFDRCIFIRPEVDDIIAKFKQLWHYQILLPGQVQ